jgi:hypothetical protein
MEEVKELLDTDQCAICEVGVDGKGHIDHCHETGAVRGLLCRGCNLGLGNFTDDIFKLERAILYLKKN